MKPLTRLASVLCLAGSTLPAHAVDVVFDYSYDSSGFFTSEKRAVLDQVARLFSQNIDDTLNPIAPSGGNVFDVRLFDPQDPLNNLVLIRDFSIPADTLRIFVGSRAFSSQTLGVGGPGFNVASGSQAFVANAQSRGEPGALLASPTDFAPWGGSITFGSTVAWHFDSDVSSLESFTGMFDFYTVAVHETAHVLGFGTADSWSARVTGDTFTGAATMLLNGGAPVALQNDGSDAHFATSLSGVANGVPQVPLLAPVIRSGTRKYMTDLDWAALDDIGWEVASLQATVPAPIPEPESWAMMLGGMLLIGATARRRM